jgi:hypothetical protein
VAWQRLFTELGVAVVTVLMLIAVAHLAPHEPRAAFDEHVVVRLRKQAPDFVLVGNSMVQTRFDERELNRLLAPGRAAVVAMGGSKTAYWYLALKNVVLRAGKPKRVLLFFRRRELTTPRENTGPAYRRELDRVSRNREPVLEAKLAPPLGAPVDRLGYELERLAPFPRLHALAGPLVQRAAHWLSGAGRGRARRRQQLALDEVFSVAALRSANLEPSTAPPERLTFEEEVGTSLLPDIIELTHRAGVALTLVRVRTRAAADHRQRASGDYEHALETYARRHEVEVVDMTDAEWEDASMYGEGDHIAPRYRTAYTRLFVTNLKRVFH